MKEIKRKSKLMLQIEKNRGECIEEVIRQLYVDKDLPIHSFCVELSISYVTALKWLELAGIYSRRLDV